MATRIRHATALVALILGQSAERLPAADAGPAKERDFVIFMGMDVALDLGSEACPVIGASSAEVHVARRGEIVRVRAAERQHRFKTTAEPKVSRTSVTVTEVKGDRVFSSARDPARDAATQQMLMDSIENHRQELADIQLSGAIARSEGVTRAERAGQPVPAEAKAAAEQGMLQAVRAVENAYGSGIGGGYDPTSEMTIDGERAPFDAFELTCRVSSPTPIQNAYALLRTMIRDPQDPGKVSSALKFFSLPTITAKPRKLVLVQFGLPPGFSIDRHELHLYANGQEIATSLSDNRVAVTAQEAFQVLLLRHLANNRTASLPIQALPQLFPSDFRARVPAMQIYRTVDLDVDAEGGVKNVRLQPVDAPEIDGYLESTLRNVRFLPALLNGAPVASSATFALSEFMQ